MKRLWLIVLVLLIGCLPVVAKPVWTVGAVGNGDEFGVIGGVRPSAEAKTEFRVEMLYLDGIRENTQTAMSGAVGATYDVFDGNVPFSFPFGLAKGTVDIRGYFGGEVGIVGNIKGPTNYDAVAAGIVGVSVGDTVNRVGVEALLPLRIASWTDLANLDDTSVFRIVLVHRF
jgi:hypothetical protein